MINPFHLAVTAAVLLLAVCTGTAAAQTDQDRAREHFAAASSYYESGDYQDALREFRRAYELSERPELFYNFALCYQQLGQHEQAAQYLELYLAQTEDVPNVSAARAPS